MNAPGVDDWCPVPPDLSCIGHNEAQHRSEEGRLARPDPACDHGEGPGRDGQVHLTDATPGVGVVIADASRLEKGEALVRPRRSGRDHRIGVVEVQVHRLRQPLRGGTTQQSGHEVGCYPGLSEPGDEQPEDMDVIGDETHEVDKQGEVAHGDASGLPDPVGRKQQHESGAEVDRVPEEGVQSLLEDSVAHHELEARLVQPAQMTYRPVLGARQLHCLDASEDLADGTGDLAGGVPRLSPRPLHHRAGPLRQDDDHDERGEHDECQLGVDRGEHPQRHRREHDRADDVHRPAQGLLDLLHVLPEAGNASPVDPGTAVAPGSSRILLIRLIRSREAIRNRKFTSFQMATKMFDYPEDGVAEEQCDQRRHVERRPGHRR